MSGEPTETLHTGTHIVIVDVVVEDRSGHPVRGLTRDNFVLTEQKKAQTISHFEEHNASTNQKPGLRAPKLPPGVFTDYTPVAPDSTLNVLLVDALNTPQTDQIYLRKQLLDFIKREKPGTNVAIFGLANQLVMLQGFTTDPEVLRTAVQHLDAKGSPLLNDPNGTGSGIQSISEGMQDLQRQVDLQTLINLQQWEAEQASLKTRMRAQFTLDAFNSLGHYLANFPGRKNLIWFSGSFPLQVEPDTSIKDPFGTMQDSNAEFRLATNLLAAAHTAVYPVDARGLITAPALDASQDAKRIIQKASDYTNDMLTFGQAQADEHITMEKLASETGGHAFYNTNALTDAVAEAIETGSSYYTLTYTPKDRTWNSAYRHIHVEITAATAKGAKLSYRRGYYADDPRRQPHGGSAAEATLDVPAIGTQANGPRANSATQAYTRAAISRGSPTPQDIIFKARVLPLTGKDEDELAPDNQPDPQGRMKAPYRTFAVDYAAFPSSFSMALLGDGRHSGAIEFGIFVYDNDGNLLNVSDKQVTLLLPPDTYKEFESNPVRLQLQVSAPVKQQSFLRLIVHDIPSNHYGAVEVPTAAVGRLPPLGAQDNQDNPANGVLSPNVTIELQPAVKQ